MESPLFAPTAMCTAACDEAPIAKYFTSSLQEKWLYINESNILARYVFVTHLLYFSFVLLNRTHLLYIYIQI